MLKLYASANLPTRLGSFRIFTFTDGNKNENAVLVKGDVTGKPAVPVRIHSECLTGDVFGSKRCDCREQLEKSLEYIESKGFGMLIYLRQEGRGIGLLKKIRAYSLQEQGYDTIEANLLQGLPVDQRDYSFAKEVLDYFQIKSVILMSNNPTKFEFLEHSGIEIVGRIPVLTDPNPFDKFYLETKKEKLGHQL